jgi:hypothetical protein
MMSVYLFQGDLEATGLVEPGVLAGASNINVGRKEFAKIDNL